ncbi:6,7-dimethyl-8-ribityllumazine synthase [Nisaea sp.]|uniref:6,7-dimethyl-8-ribityllumazine synthase n=1 Tax=Nisaea sp. TaxID=2024842 RepID=UPI003B52A2A4
MSRILIVEARFYEDIADELVKGASAALESAGAEFERLEVPGALEIPAAISFASQRTDAPVFDGYVALGCVIRGETTHYDYVCGESARGLQDLALWEGLAIGNGILTVENREQAWARASVAQKNKGRDAAEAALAMAAIKSRFGIE